MFTAEELDILSKALVNNELLKKGSDLYYNFRKSMKKNKQVKSDLIAKLCLKLIRDKTTLDPTLESEFDEEFIKIMNSFPGKSYKDIIVIMKDNWVAARENVRKTNLLRYEYQIDNKKLQETNYNLKLQISSLDNEIKRLRNPTREDIYY